MQAPPKPKHTPPEPMQHCNMGVQLGAKNLLTFPKAVRLPTNHLTA
jgi:hypothetical protein